jgi:hypothetical protein
LLQLAGQTVHLLLAALSLLLQRQAGALGVLHTSRQQQCSCRTKTAAELQHLLLLPMAAHQKRVCVMPCQL